MALRHLPPFAAGPKSLWGRVATRKANPLRCGAACAAGRPYRCSVTDTGRPSTANAVAST
jgi:hypothetical protein